MLSTETSSPDAERARGQAQRLQVQQEARIGDVRGGCIQRRRARALRSCLHRVFCFMRTRPSCMRPILTGLLSTTSQDEQPIYHTQEDTTPLHVVTWAEW